MLDSREFFFFQAEDGIRGDLVTGVQTCALPILIGCPARVFRAFDAGFRSLDNLSTSDAAGSSEDVVRRGGLRRGGRSWRSRYGCARVGGGEGTVTTRIELSELARRGMESVPVYIGDATPCAVDLSDNTNLWGAPPAVLRALHSADVSVLARYPATYAGSLRDALLEHVGLSGADGTDVVTGCGSDDVLDSAMRAFAQPGECIAFSSPTFSMIPTFAPLNGLTPPPLPFAPRFELDPERLVDPRAKLPYVCAPTNPPGTPGTPPP